MLERYEPRGGRRLPTAARRFEALEASHFDVVLMDVQMPRNGRLPGRPIIREREGTDRKAPADPRVDRPCHARRSRALPEWRFRRLSGQAVPPTRPSDGTLIARSAKPGHGCAVIGRLLRTIGCRSVVGTRPSVASWLIRFWNRAHAASRGIETALELAIRRSLAAQAHALKGISRDDRGRRPRHTLRRTGRNSVSVDQLHRRRSRRRSARRRAGNMFGPHWNSSSPRETKK